MQRDETVVTSVEQARALQDTGFLGWFLEPASPSDVARQLEIPANLAHHHARRHVGLGLLVEVKHEHGRVYYQLAAKTFKHHRSLLPVGDPAEQTRVVLEILRKGLLTAYEEICDGTASGQDADWHVYSFDRNSLPNAGLDVSPEDAAPVRPPHLQVRTLSLPAERYRELVKQIAALIAAAETDAEPGVRPCTLAFLAMDGALQAGSIDNQYLSSFLPLNGLTNYANRSMAKRPAESAEEKPEDEITPSVQRLRNKGSQY